LTSNLAATKRKTEKATTEAYTNSSIALQNISGALVRSAEFNVHFQNNGVHCRVILQHLQQVLITRDYTACSK